MKLFSLLPGIVAKEKPALLFFLKLLILLCGIKCIFFFYNANIADGWAISDVAGGLAVIKWSLFYDLFSVVLINLPLVLLLLLLPVRYLQKKQVYSTLVWLFTLLNTFCILLNLVDIFYFRFHLQRADADLLYVLRNPFENGTILVMGVLVALLAAGIITGLFIYRDLKRVATGIPATGRCYFTGGLLMVSALLFTLQGKKVIVPTYPLTHLKPVQLPLAQNSFHTFLFSLYRMKELSIPDRTYMAKDAAARLFPLIKTNQPVATKPKNIVLFIMESVPLEFFTAGGKDKVAMPFFDSLLNHSSFFSNAFSYAYSSNKGITALLAGIPTMTDIPLYHSNFVSIPHTSVGKVLAEKGYRSDFFIGDNYDDFGFAQCCKWLGIQHYYCMEDIPGYQQMEKHSMGLHDEYVLDFMAKKMKDIQPPFFTVQYNISTHYPNDLPSGFIERYPQQNRTPQMKTMQYYSECLQHFFSFAATQPWYHNTVFIFCADHWAQPAADKVKVDEVESFRIPIILFDPSEQKKENIQATVSQLDIMNTILYYAGVKDSFLSYGTSLRDSVLNPGRTVFTKTNSAVYEAINQQYVLGFDAAENKAVYCYDYKRDPAKTGNLLKKPRFTGADSLIISMKAYLQSACDHYRKRR